MSALSHVDVGRSYLRGLAVPQTLDEVNRLSYLELDVARAMVPPDNPADYTIIDGRVLLNAGRSPKGFSRLSAAVRCLQLYAYLYGVLSGDPRCQFPDTPPLIRGSLFHIAAAHYYKRLHAVQTGADPDRFHTPERAIELLAHLEDHDSGRHPESPWWYAFVAEAQAAIRAYIADRRSREDVQIIAVELSFGLLFDTLGWSLDPAVLSYLMTMRLDVGWWERDGLVRFADHKTRGREDARQERGYARDGQFQAIRAVGGLLFGRHFRGMATNYATFRHPADERAKPDPKFKFKFARLGPPPLPWRMECLGDLVRYTEWQISSLEAAGVDGWRYPKAMVGNGVCEHRYGPCQAAHLCDFGPEGSCGAPMLPSTSDGRKVEMRQW